MSPTSRHSAAIACGECGACDGERGALRRAHRPTVERDAPAAVLRDDGDLFPEALHGSSGRTPAAREQQRHHGEIEHADQHDRDADPAVGRLPGERETAADQDEADRDEGGAHQAHDREGKEAFLGKSVGGLGHASALSPPRCRINCASAPWPVASTPSITRPRSSADLFCDSLIVGRHAVMPISNPTMAPVILLNNAGFILSRVHGGFAPTRASWSGGQRVELCDQFGIVEFARRAFHLDRDIVPRRHLVGIGVPARADIGVGPCTTASAFVPARCRVSALPRARWNCSVVRSSLSTTGACATRGPSGVLERSRQSRSRARAVRRDRPAAAEGGVRMHQLALGGRAGCFFALGFLPAAFRRRLAGLARFRFRLGFGLADEVGRLAVGGAAAPLAAPRLADLLAVRLCLRLQRRFRRRAFFGRVDPDFAEQQVEAERVEARGEMFGHLGADVDRAAVGMVDAQRGGCADASCG